MINRPDTPKPWHNRITNGAYTAEVSQVGGGSGVACAEQPASVLSNNPSSRVIYLRDNDTEEFWSLGHFPCQKPYESFQATHGLGWSTVSSAAQKIDSAVTFFVPPNDSCEIWQIKISNAERKKRRLSIFVLADFDSSGAVECQLKNNGLFVTTKGTAQEVLRYVALDHAVDSYDTDRESFFGEYRTAANPRAIEDGKCARSQASNQPIGVLQRNITLGPSTTSELLVIIGAQNIEQGDGSHTQARSNAIRRAETVIEKYRRPHAAEAALEEVKKFWQDICENVSVNSPDDSLNITQSIWAKYQAVNSFLHGSAQGGTAEVAQQVLAVLPILGPSATERLEQLFSVQLKDGRGTSQSSTDAPAWLIITAVRSLQESGESNWLKKQLPYSDSGSGSILEHLIRAAEYCVGELNSRSLVEKDRHESTVGSSLVALALKELLPLLETNGEHHLVRKYTQKIEELSRSLSVRMWDGSWYLAIRNHSRVGSKKSVARKIDLAAQVWPVLAGLASKERAEKVLNSTWRLLNTPAGLMNFAPPYSRYETENPESRFAGGERENGGISLVLAALALSAEAQLGRGDLAYRIFQQHNFCYRSENQDTYKVEPFTYPASFFGPANPHFGQGQGAWDELSGGWMWRTILEQMLGAKPTLHGLKIDPCIPRDWRQVEYSRRFRGAEYHIRILNPTRQNNLIDRITVDGIRQTGNVIKPFQTGSHYVEVFLG